jgi:aspartate aminotransferase
MVVNKLNTIGDLNCTMPQGAFYVFPNMEAYIGRKNGETKLKGSADFCNYLLEEAQVAVVPGSAFGAEGYFRISYAASLQQLEKAVGRIEQALDKLG